MQQVLSVSDEPEKLLDGLLNPPVDVKEYPGCYVFLVDMPGLKDTDIKVEVEEEKVLCVSGERKRNDQVQNIKGKYIHLERRFGKFTRKLILPDHCNLEEISGVCLNGVLTVTVPKLLPPEPRSPKTIKVKIG